jgi:hypothetical protein
LIAICELPFALRAFPKWALSAGGCGTLLHTLIRK